MEYNEYKDKLQEIEERVSREEKNSQQLLGFFLIEVAILYLLELAAKAVIRMIFPGQTMLIGAYESYLGWIRLALVVVALIYNIYRMKKMFFHLPATRKLVVLWGVILVPIQLINDLTVMLYTRMLVLVQTVLMQSGSDPEGKIFALVYDSTHGFKYICLFLAILLGIVMTAEILEKRKLTIFAAFVAVLFMLAFVLLKMQSFTLDSASSIEVGINWTSTIFHLLTTFGLFMVGLYIVLVFTNKRSAGKEQKEQD